MNCHETNRRVFSSPTALDLFGKAGQWMSLLLIAALPSVSFAQQFDAPFVAFQEKHADKWEKEDKLKFPSLIMLRAA